MFSPFSATSSFAFKLPVSVLVKLFVAFTFTEAFSDVTLPALVISFAAKVTFSFATKLPVLVFSNVLFALTSIVPFGDTTEPLLVMFSPFKVALPSFAITAASFKISNSPVVFKVTFAPSIEPPTVASLALTVTSFLATKLPESVFTKDSVAFTLTLPAVAFTSPSLTMVVAFKLTSFSVASISEPGLVAIAFASISTSFAFRLPVSVLVKFSVASTSILPFSAVTVPLLVIFSPFKVAVPLVALTFAASSTVKLPVVFKVTFPPVTLPSTSALVAVTFTASFATKLPLSVFVKLLVALTSTVPFSAFTVPLLVMSLPFNAASPSVDFTVAFSPIFKVSVAFNVTSSFAVMVAFWLTVTLVAFTSTVALSDVTFPPTVASFASIVTASFAFKLPVSVLVKLFVASTSIVPFGDTTEPLLVMFSPFKVAVPLVALTFAPSSTVKLPVAFRVTFEPDTLPATSAFIAFTVAFSFATKLPVGVFVKLFTASTATFAAFTVPLLVMSLPFNAASPSVDFTVAFSPIFKVSVAFNVTSSFAVMVAFWLTVTLVAFTSTVALSDVTFPPTVASFASIVTASFAFKLPVSVLVKLFVASTSIVPFGDTTVPLLVMFSPFKVAVPLVAFTVAFSPMLISVAFKVIFAPLIFPLVVSAVAFTVTFSLALMLEFSAVVKLVTSKVALVAFTVPLFVKSVDVTAKLPVTFNVPLPVISALLPLMFKPESEFTVVFTLTVRSPLEESVAFAPLKLSGFAPVIVKSPPSRLLISDVV